ncbi:MAG: methyltransferase [Clostridiales bacterium]
MKNKRIVKHLLTPVLKVMASRYLERERIYSYNGLSLRISPGVFHPGMFFSTKILLNYLLCFDLKNKKVLELGAGSGLISMAAASKGAMATASEISKTALHDLGFNSSANNLPVNIIQSDLFDNIPDAGFDFIIINPPYFPLDPMKESEYAWCCGRDFQYFRKLFLQLNRFKNCKAEILMILSEDCAIDSIKKIAFESGIVLNRVKEVRNWFEENYIFSLKLNDFG